MEQTPIILYSGNPNARGRIRMVDLEQTNSDQLLFMLKKIFFIKTN